MPNIIRPAGHFNFDTRVAGHMTEKVQIRKEIDLKQCYYKLWI